MATVVMVVVTLLFGYLTYYFQFGDGEQMALACSFL